MYFHSVFFMGSCADDHSTVPKQKFLGCRINDLKISMIHTYLFYFLSSLYINMG